MGAISSLLAHAQTAPSQSLNAVVCGLGQSSFVVGEGTGSRILLIHMYNYRWQHK